MEADAADADAFAEAEGAGEWPAANADTANKPVTRAAISVFIFISL